MKRLYAVLVIVGAAILMAAPALYAQDLNTAIEFLRTDVKAAKQEIMAKAMNLTEKEAGVFWPVYRRYQADFDKIADERVAIIKDYAANYEKMTGEKTTELIEKLFATEKKRTDLKQKYFKELSKLLSPQIAARFIQVENYLVKLVDLSIGGEVPLMPKPERKNPQ
jgi:hypothetical protein